jgi:hypothetical protein
MQLVKDFWRCGIIADDVRHLARAGTLDRAEVRWLPNRDPLHYYADPFGLWRDERLYLFLESFSYRRGIGHIDVLVLDRDLAITDQRVALQEPWHLSYPFVFEADGETWLLPEAHESGALWLYRANSFPVGWERAHQIVLDHVPLDASLIRHKGKWWVFYTPADPPGARLTHLCAAWAERLDGPWQSHPANPILVDAGGARPGGTLFVMDGAVHLPIQRCQGSYGSGLRLLRFDRLTPARTAATIVSTLDAPSLAAPFTDGCHTLSAAGAVTLIDTKQMRFSAAALAAWPERWLRRRRTPGDQFA